MKDFKSQLVALFQALDERIGQMDRERRREGHPPIPRARVRLLGQVSLLAQERASAVLSLYQTADMDALLDMDHVVKEELKSLLKSHGYVYDDDSHLIWIPAGSAFVPFLDLENLAVECIDPESALVSKAVKAPEKNLQLIRQAIASGKFPALIDRILKNGGKLEGFL